MIQEISLNNFEPFKPLVNDLINLNEIKKDLISNPFSHYIIYIIDNMVVGFTHYLLIYDRIEIADIEVKPAFRRQSIATKMMNYIIDESIKNRCQNITLEVRKSNLIAINLYQKLGFKEKTIRPQYYGDEDGLLMEKELINNERCVHISH